MSLARELGKTKRELLAGLDSYEMMEWMAYFRAEALEQGQTTNLQEDKAKVAKQRRGR